MAEVNDNGSIQLFEDQKIRTALLYLYGSHLFAEEYTPEGENLMKVIPMEL